jgi:hypothetical protein
MILVATRCQLARATIETYERKKTPLRNGVFLRIDLNVGPTLSFADLPADRRAGLGT